MIFFSWQIIIYFEIDPTLRLKLVEYDVGMMVVVQNSSAYVGCTLWSFQSKSESVHMCTHTHIICGIHHTHWHSQLPNNFLKEISLKSEDYIIAFYRNYIIIFLKLKIWTYMILWIIRITSSPLISLLTCCGSLFYTWKIINQTLFLFKWNPVQAWSNKMTVAI
jgi:hypothetical protein